MKRPSAWLPLVMSSLALFVVVIHIALFGAQREADEGTAAHLWQLLMALQLPVIAFFVLSGLSRAPRETGYILAAQLGAAALAAAPVYLLGL